MNTGINLTRMPSDSDMASVISDEASLSSPPLNKGLGGKTHWSINNILSTSLSVNEREAALKVDASAIPEDLDLFARCVKLEFVQIS